MNVQGSFGKHTEANTKDQGENVQLCLVGGQVYRSHFQLNWSEGRCCTGQGNRRGPDDEFAEPGSFLGLTGY